MMGLFDQIVWLLLLALPVACVSWTVTHEEIFREPREWLAELSHTCEHWYQRKTCYVLTCEYCFSHYVAAAVLWIMDFPMLRPDWRGYLVSWFALVAVANVYMSAYSRLRVEIRKEKTEISLVEEQKAGASNGNGARAASTEFAEFNPNRRNI